MSAAKHTPGPWTVHHKPVLTKPLAAIELSKLVEGTGEFSGVLPMVVGANGLCTAVTGCGPDGVENARLIAAAPDLLEACQAQHRAIDILMANLIAVDANFMPTKSVVWPTCLAGIAAIAKATGSAS